MTYIYWIPALVGYFSVAAFAGFENLQTTRIEQSTQSCVQNSTEQNYQELSGRVAQNEMKNLETKPKTSFCARSQE